MCWNVYSAFAPGMLMKRGRGEELMVSFRYSHEEGPLTNYFFIFEGFNQKSNADVMLLKHVARSGVFLLRPLSCG